MTALRMAMNVAGTFWERRKWPDLHYIDHVELHIIETHSPQPSSSFNMFGEFDFSDEKLQDTISVLPFKSRPNSSLKIGRHQIDNTNAVSKGYRKPYGGLRTFASLGPVLGQYSPSKYPPPRNSHRNFRENSSEYNIRS